MAKHLLAALTVALVAATAGDASAHIVIYNFPTAVLASTVGGADAPPGANDWDCVPSSAHPRPVVLVHGTFENQRMNWNALSPLLANNGYCVFSFNYGAQAATLGQFYGLGPIEASAGQLRTFVDLVRSATGAAKVDLVGHSQGGMMPRYYLKNLGGAAVVNRLIALSPSNHGTSLAGLVFLAEKIGFIGGAVDAVCPACMQQIRGSEFNRSLDAGGDTVSGVKYTVIVSQYDEVVTPYTNGYLSGSNVTNINLQNGCFLDFAEHIAISYDRRALYHVLNALDPAHPRWIPCYPIAAFIGG